jgi:small subunit ribosomal protein S21
MVGRRNRHANQFLDITQERRLRGVAQRDGDAFRSGSRCAAYAVHIGFRHVRQVEIDHVADAIDVDAAGGNVSGNQRAHLALAEAGQCAITLMLRLVAVDGLRGYAGLNKTAHDPVSTMLCACEYESSVNRFALQDVCKNLVFGCTINSDKALLDAGNRRARRHHSCLHRVAQHRTRELHYGARHRSGKQQRLPVARQLRDYLMDIVDEAHIEHSIGFVEDEKLDFAKTESITFYKVKLLISAERNSNNKIGKHLQVFVRENNVDQALRILKKKMQREGIFREMKRRKAYEKPSERKTREKAEAIRRARKAARKQAQREGLIPAPKRRDDTRGVGRGRPRFGSGAA